MGMKKLHLSIILAILIAAPSANALAQEDGLDIVTVGASALDIEIAGNKVYVSDPADGTISVLDANTNQIIDTIMTQKGVLLIEVAAERNQIYVTVEDQNKVLIFDLQTHVQVGEIDLGEPEITLFSKADKPYGQREYTTFATSGIGLAYHEGNKMLYVVHSEVNHVNVVDTQTNQVVQTIPVGKTPLLIEIDDITNTAYVTNWESNDVSIIDLNTHEVIGSLQTGFIPDQMVIDDERHKLYVTHHASPHVSVVDLTTRSIEKNIQLKGPTHAIALDKISGLLHVTYTPESGVTGTGFINRVEFIDTKTNTLVGGYDIPDNPFMMAISDNQKLYGSVIKNGQVFIVNLPERVRYQEVVAQTEQTANQDDISGGCLIATASYGTELAPQVQLLREVRDNVLLGTNSGTAFMSAFNSVYYSFSPVVADLERDNPILKEAVKITITPMLSTLSILSYVDIDSEQQMLGYGIGIILLNLGIYFAVPAVILLKIKSKLH